MLSLLTRLFKRSEATPSTAEESFAARFHRFRLFLSAHIDAYSEIMAFEERLASEHPLGLPFIRMTLAKLTVATMQCIMQLNALSNQGYTRLNAPFAALRAAVQDILNQGTCPLEGPLVLPIHAITQEHRLLVSPNILKICPIRDAHPEFVAPGFVVTGAAWWLYFNNADMHEEIDRIMLISQEDPGSYGEAAATIRERIPASFPLPETLCNEVGKALEPLKELLGKPDNSLLVRCFPTLPEHGALVMPEQVLHGPITDTQAILQSLHTAMTMAYRPRAMIYRLKLGIRDRGMPFCVSFSVIPTKQARGSAHRNLDPQSGSDLVIHLRRKVSTTEDPPQGYAEDARLPDSLHESVARHCLTALDCLADAPIRGNRHEVYWAASENHDFYLLGVTSLPDPHPAEEAHPAEPQAAAHTITLHGGKTTYPGSVTGPPILVRNLRDALAFPIGGVLVVDLAAPRWTFLLDFATGAIAREGSDQGIFARVARRNGRPTVIGYPGALDLPTRGTTLRLNAPMHQEARATLSSKPLPIRSEHTARTAAAGGTAKDAPEPAFPNADAPSAAAPISGGHDAQKAQDTQIGHTWLPTSTVAAIARELAPKVALLSFSGTDDPNFRAENCVSFHDFITYSHDHAVAEMFRHGTSRKGAQAPAKQLVCDVPKQFWIINLDDGFYGDIKGPTVPLEEIASLPMRSLWEGFSDKPWDGPPQINARGFLSVLFEATQNPNIDPASQSTHYTEKNVFLIARRFCSMRCRFGFHFLSLDALLGERERERFIIFQFKGGAANMARRVRRVQFVAELLAQFDMATEIVGDTLTARMEQGDETAFLSVLRVIGYLVMHTRQLDMIMSDEIELAKRRTDMLADMKRLALRPPLVLP